MGGHTERTRTTKYNVTGLPNVEPQRHDMVRQLTKSKMGKGNEKKTEEIENGMGNQGRRKRAEAGNRKRRQLGGRLGKAEVKEKGKRMKKVKGERESNGRNNGGWKGERQSKDDRHEDNVGI